MVVWDVLKGRATDLKAKGCVWYVIAGHGRHKGLAWGTLKVTITTSIHRTASIGFASTKRESPGVAAGSWYKSEQKRRLCQLTKLIKRMINLTNDKPCDPKIEPKLESNFDSGT